METKFSAIDSKQSDVAAGSSWWPMLLAVLSILALAGSCSETRNTEAEKVVITELSRGPSSFSNFRKRVLRALPSEATHSYFDSAAIDDAAWAQKEVRRRETVYSTQTVWAPHGSVDDVRYVYNVPIHGSGLGGGDIKSSFALYVAEDDSIVGWHTSTAEWRDKIEPHWK